MKQVNVFEVWETNLMICLSEFTKPCKNVPEFLHQLHKAGKELKNPFGVSLKGDNKVYTYNGEIRTRRGDLVGAFSLKSNFATEEN